MHADCLAHADCLDQKVDSVVVKFVKVVTLVTLNHLWLQFVYQERENSNKYSENKFFVTFYERIIILNRCSL